MTRDAYELFFEEFIGENKDKFFKFGLEQTIYANEISIKNASDKWEDLKLRLTSDQPIYIRRYGTGGRNTHLYKDFYANVFENEELREDPTNNSMPRKLIEELTGYMKKPRKGYTKIQNYQVSHVFGKTKNALAFTAPWNIVYLPKLLDPFTGHEAKGSDVANFTALFKNQCIDQFGDMINEFNEIMKSDNVSSKLDSGIDYVAKTNSLDEKQKQQFEKSVYSEFEPIPLENY